MQGHSMIAKSVAIFGKARRPKTSTLVFFGVQIGFVL